MRRIRGVALAAIMVAVLVGLLLVWAKPPGAPSDLVFVGGDIITLAEPAVVGAMWVKDARIQAVGSEEEVRGAAGPDAKIIDLEGAAIMPVLIEPHTHPLATALLGTAIDVTGFTHDSRADALRALREGAAGFTPGPWIVAFGWDPVMVPDLELRA